MSDPTEPPDSDLDDLRRVDLAELDGPAYDTARVLDDWLHRCHGVIPRGRRDTSCWRAVRGTRRR
jgi:hypothetical protein